MSDAGQWLDETFSEVYISFECFSFTVFKSRSCMLLLVTMTIVVQVVNKTGQNGTLKYQFSMEVQ